MKQHPTFEELREQRELSVINPENGCRFRVSLRDWESCLWAIRIYPHQQLASDSGNPFVTAHRILNRDTIEEWLTRLRLARSGGKEICQAGFSTKARQ